VPLIPLVRNRQQGRKIGEGKVALSKKNREEFLVLG
jgi:hypothetical protein